MTPDTQAGPLDTRPSALELLLYAATVVLGIAGSALLPWMGAW